MQTVWIHREFSKTTSTCHKDLVWFGKHENYRYYNYTDEEVKDGTKQKGERKEGHSQKQGGSLLKGLLAPVYSGGSDVNPFEEVLKHKKKKKKGQDQSLGLEW